jgi:prepilin-type N-terminal cleavage/methylation domain-containing protein
VPAAALYGTRRWLELKRTHCMLDITDEIEKTDDLSPRLRAGFTLLELMLVLAVLTVIGAIASPMLGSAFERQALRAGAETLRLQWEEARLKAMKTGQAQVFMCQLGTNSYSIKPLMLQSDLTNVGQGATLATMGGLVQTQNMGGGTVVVAADPTVSYDKQLEEKLSFLSCMAVSDMRAAVVAQDAQMSGSGDVNMQTMASSVFFYPDGSTSTAEVRIQSERGDVRILRIRGLTGHIQLLELNSLPSK